MPALLASPRRERMVREADPPVMAENATMMCLCRHNLNGARRSRRRLSALLMVGLALLAMPTGHARSARGQSYPDQVPAWPNADGRLPPVTPQYPHAPADALPSAPESYSVYPQPAQQV